MSSPRQVCLQPRACMPPSASLGRAAHSSIAMPGPASPPLHSGRGVGRWRPQSRTWSAAATCRRRARRTLWRPGAPPRWCSTSAPAGAARSSRRGAQTLRMPCLMQDATACSVRVSQRPARARRGRAPATLGRAAGRRPTWQLRHVRVRGSSARVPWYGRMQGTAGVRPTRAPPPRLAGERACSNRDAGPRRRAPGAGGRGVRRAGRRRRLRERCGGGPAAPPRVRGASARLTAWAPSPWSRGGHQPERACLRRAVAW